MTHPLYNEGKIYILYIFAIYAKMQIYFVFLRSSLEPQWDLHILSICNVIKISTV